MDNRERARARDKKQRRQISLEEKHENLIAGVRKWEMLAATKVKMSGSEKKQWTGTHTSIQHFPYKMCNQEVLCCSCAKQQQRNVQKSVLQVQSCFFFLISDLLFFLLLFLFLSLFSITILVFVWVLNYKSILTRASLLALAKSIFYLLNKQGLTGNAKNNNKYWFAGMSNKNIIVNIIM